MTGYIKTIRLDKGYGFVTAQDGTDLFFHRSDVLGNFEDLQADDEVNFESTSTPKGARAAQVERVTSVASVQPANGG